jgi:peptidoglycan/LPS O-acetylase OafA/YrhL
MPTVLEKGDYSYGVYLYHLPLLQLLIHINSDVFVGPWGFAMLAVFGLPFVFAVAAMSWHGIEKPILAFRKKFSFQAQHLGTDRPTFPAVPSPAAVNERASQ